MCKSWHNSSWYSYAAFTLFGAKEIVLVGIDLTDSYRFDGSFNVKNSEPKWMDIINKLNNVIDKKEDCSYFSLGETRLNIECI